MKYSHVIWDFNGTILNDTDAAIKSENVLLSRRNMPLIESIEQYHSVFCFPIIEYYKRLGHSFEKESYEEMSKEWVAEYLVYSQISPLHTGVLDMLRFVKQKGYTQIILSATESSMLKKQVEDLGIADYFDALIGLDNIHAHSKVGIAKEWFIKEKPDKAVMLGDTTHDFEVASAISADCILIAQGHQSYETLSTLGVPVFHSLEEVLGSGIL